MATLRVDTLIRGGTVLTVSPTAPRTDAVAILGDRVVAVGDDAAALPARHVVDLDGRTVVPGFNDAHNHLLAHGLWLDAVPLHSPPTATIAELTRSVAAAARGLPDGAWLIGSGYDQNKLAERRHPTRAELDVAAPGLRVWLHHVSGHMSVVNTRVLHELGWPDVDVPAGGVVVTDDDGPTGLIQESAQELVKRLRWPTALDELVDAIDVASRGYAAEGVTTSQEAGIGGGLVGSSALDVAAFLEARRQERLHVRCTLMVAAEALHDVARDERDPDGLHLDLGIRTGLGDHRVRIGATKIFADGSLIGRTAAMTHDFADEPGNRGYLAMSEEQLAATILRAHRAGWQIATHAIGDHAIRAVLDAYQAALADTPRPDRHRIEHCAVLPDALLDRLAGTGVIPVPQGRFVSEIGDGMIDALGPERVPWTYRQRSFLDRGVVLPGSSDRPVVNGAPLLGIEDLVLRRTSSGRPFAPQEALTPEQALHAYTLGSAHAAFDERNRGSLDPGKLADLVILADDPTRCDPDGIGAIEVAATMLGGAWVHGADGVVG